MDRNRDRRDRDRDREKSDGLTEKLIKINRVAKVVKGGRRFSFSAVVVVGDQNGKVGYGFGKANDITEAIRKAVERAKSAMIQIPMKNSTIPHEIIGKYKGASVLLKLAVPGTELSPAVRFERSAMRQESTTSSASRLAPRTISIP